MKNKKPYNIYNIITAIVIVIALFYLLKSFSIGSEQNTETSGSVTQPQRLIYHAHADFKVFLNGKELSFNLKKYDVANPFMHMHLNNPDGDKLIHIEGLANMTINIFFQSLGIKFNATCFILDNVQNFCNQPDKKIRFLVNGKENLEFDYYIPEDSDRILITYGNETGEEITKQMDSVTSYACIYSRKCPERIPTLPVPEEQLTF